ncbi:type-1 angiotensin II receptor-associated protein isoform X2 [Hemicordylus capensis]|uniref:type-1 angiotensin II receptor-associated protein isoform X2 n=1 Tax=Hemicordylus capensis TaxID=884348 RepID=UPI0023045E75|nr:type-1 angiotensin II receptor-associated protein isoform X2 [Hemicordylus capensis]
MEVPAVNLKAIVLVHWLLTTWGGLITWLPSSYAWGNYTILALGVWAVAQRDSVDAILMFFTGLLLTILTDIIHISIYYPVIPSLTDTVRFSAGMVIFSLLLKPISCFLAYQMYRERGGEYAFNLDPESPLGINFVCNGFLHVGQDRSAYQSIDTPEPPRPYPDVASKPGPPLPY